MSILKSLLRKLGYDLVRHVEMPSHPPDVLTLAVDARIASGRPCSFLQIGANDGVMNDPIRHLILKHNLPGLFVEPLPDHFARLQANYAGRSQLKFEPSAVGDTDGTATLYRVRPDPNLPEWLQGIASFNRDHLNGRRFGVPGLEAHVEPVIVPVLTLANLLRKHHLKSIDLLQVDTEGFDIRIVRGALAMGLRPAIINYEFIYATPADRVACKRDLEAAGYTFVDLGRDTLALHSES